jgi:hypothetical protein
VTVRGEPNTPQKCRFTIFKFLVAPIATCDRLSSHEISQFQALAGQSQRPQILVMSQFLSGLSLTDKRQRLGMGAYLLEGKPSQDWQRRTGQGILRDSKEQMMLHRKYPCPLKCPLDRSGPASAILSLLWDQNAWNQATGRGQGIFSLAHKQGRQGTTRSRRCILIPRHEYALI